MFRYTAESPNHQLLPKCVYYGRARKQVGKGCLFFHESVHQDTRFNSRSRLHP